MSRREYPRYALVGVGAVVFRDGKILLVKRGSPPGVGYWAVPGGAVEAGERLAEAAARELKEETGLTGTPVGVVHIDEVIVRDEQGVKYHYVLIDFLFENVKGEVKPSSDVIDVKWFTLDEALNLEKLSPQTRRLIKKLKKGLTLLPLS